MRVSCSLISYYLNKYNKLNFHGFCSYWSHFGLYYIHFECILCVYRLYMAIHQYMLAKLVYNKEQSDLSFNQFAGFKHYYLQVNVKMNVFGCTQNFRRESNGTTFSLFPTPRSIDRLPYPYGFIFRFHIDLNDRPSQS